MQPAGASRGDLFDQSLSLVLLIRPGKALTPFGPVEVRPSFDRRAYFKHILAGSINAT